MRHLPGDPPQVQAPITEGDGRTLGKLPAAGDLFRQLTDDRQPNG